MTRRIKSRTRDPPLISIPAYPFLRLKGGLRVQGCYGKTKRGVTEELTYTVKQSIQLLNQKIEALEMKTKGSGPLPQPLPGCFRLEFRVVQGPF